MSLPALLALAALSSPAPAALAAQAVAAAVASPSARAELLELRLTAGASCAASSAEALRPVAASGEVPLRFAGVDLDGGECQAFGWARVRVTAPGLVASRTVTAGEPLAEAVSPGQVELRPGRPAALTEVPAGARAARTLAAGLPVLPSDVRQGPLPGEPVTVVVRAGGLEITQTGRALACARGRACALLPGGRRVEGRIEAAGLVVEAP